MLAKLIINRHAVIALTLCLNALFQWDLFTTKEYKPSEFTTFLPFTVFQVIEILEFLKSEIYSEKGQNSNNKA